PEAVARRSMLRIQRARVVLRPHTPPHATPGHLSAHFEFGGQRHYFPLDTADPQAATRRARVIQSTLHKEGLLAASARFPQERTVALHWSANPLVWTYFTIYSRPDSPMPPIRSDGSENPAVRDVVLIEPAQGLRQAFVVAINQHQSFRCSAAFERPEDALEALVRETPGLLLLNHSLDGLAAPQFLDRLERMRPGIPSLTYAVYDDSDHVFRATPGGVDGYLLKRTSADRLLDPLVEIPTSRSIEVADLPTHALRWFQRSIGSTAPGGSRPDLNRLTARELEILALLSQGCLDKEIAGKLQISIWTVHGHAKSIYEKLGVHSRTEAAVRYLQK
ncbi:MAG TPA: hypothetical protein DCE44_14215, partial [Verrucomicrobiales bacterium]|nr:hypothetical protein [Verrucomicrobiales bacterium]